MPTWPRPNDAKLIKQQKVKQQANSAQITRRVTIGLSQMVEDATSLPPSGNGSVEDDVRSRWQLFVKFSAIERSALIQELS